MRARPRPGGAARPSRRPETLSRVGDGQRECRPVQRADGVPRPAKSARRTFRSVSACVGVRGPRRSARGRPQGLQFCRAGFAGRGTALARSTDATRSRPFPFPTRDKGLGSLSPEHRLHLLEEALRQRVHLLAREAGELLEQLPLPGRELARRLDDHADDLVSPAVAVQVGDAAPLQREDLARLGASGHLDPRLALERRHIDLHPQGRLREAERDLAHDVVPLAHEERMLAHAEHDVEVAGCAGVRPGLAFAAQLESGAAVDAGRDLDVELVRPPLHAGALAAGARIRDDGALPVAVAARLGDREEALLEAHLPRAAALRAGARRGPRLGAASAARVARRQAGHRDRLLAPERRLLEADLEIVAEVLPAPRPTAPAAGPARAEEVSEQVADDVLEVAAEVEARASRRALREGGVPEAVVEAPPLRIGEHLVGLRDLLEALLGLVAVVGIAVGMILEGELAVSFLDVVLGRGAGHTEDLVVVALHRKTKKSPHPRAGEGSSTLCTGSPQARTGAYSFTSSNSASTTSSLPFPSGAAPSPCGASPPLPACDAFA